MNPPSTFAGSESPPAESRTSEIVSQSEIEKLLAQVESVSPSAQGGDAAGPEELAGRDAVRRHDFPKHSLFSSSELRPLRVRHEDFISALAARLSIHTGLEIGLQMSKLEAMPFQQFTTGLSNPTYLTLLKLQPLAGICLLDIPPRLGLSIVDRELGGPGRVQDETRQIGKIEARLLAPVVNLIVNEWCIIWKDLMEIRPAVLGNESNSRYLRSSTSSTSLLVVGIQVTMGETVDQMQIAFPHPMLEPLTLKLNAGGNSAEKPDLAAKTGPARWNPLFDNIAIEVRAELPDIELPAGQVASLKPGDILPLPKEFMSQVHLRVGDHLGFLGTLGLSDQRRAVKIDKCLKG